MIHELLKGVYEVLGTQGLPDDPKAAEMVMMSQDTLPYEMWDLRLGPVIWERFLESYTDELFEDDLKEIQNYFFLILLKSYLLVGFFSCVFCFLRKQIPVVHHSMKRLR